MGQSAVFKLVIGEDTFLVGRVVEQFLQDCVEAEAKEFDFERISLAEANIDQALTAMNTQPWMAAFRSVILEDLERAGGADLEKLAAYAADPNPRCHVLLVAKKIDKRKSFFKTFKKHGEVVECKAPYANEVPRFLIDQAQSMGISLEPGVAEYLCEVSGHHIQTLVSELQKLSVYVLPKTHISKQDVSAVVSPGLIDNVFAIAALIGRKDYSKAYFVYKTLIEQGESVHKILALMTGHFRKLFLLKTSNSLRQSTQQVAASLNIPQFFLKDYQSQCQKFTLSDIHNNYKHLCQCALDIRSSRIAAKTHFESVLQSICV